MALSCDVSCSKSVEECFAAAMKQYSKPVTLLSNAAGITDDAFIKKMSEQQFESVCNVNLKVSFIKKMSEQQFENVCNVNLKVSFQ